ncbi:MAG: CAF17-like 4Fe-4S cluster assembly/insertion protein YgfZ, partial [Acidimicrobiales bacterium]
MRPGYEADYLCLADGCGAVPIQRDVIEVAGPDAMAWLQGQLSQDVAALADGEAALSFLLEPQGRLTCLLRVTRISATRFWLVVEAGYGQAAYERLRRFKLRVSAEMTVSKVAGLMVRSAGGPPAGPLAGGGAGPAAAVPMEAVPMEAVPMEAVPVEAVPVAAVPVAVGSSWPGSPGYELLGEGASLPPGIRECGGDAWAPLRIELGIPAMGPELTERTIPAETGLLSSAVSFTKGCYTGQELVARMDARGNRAPRKLWGIELVAAGEELGAAGREPAAAGRRLAAGEPPGAGTGLPEAGSPVTV